MSILEIIFLAITGSVLVYVFVKSAFSPLLPIDMNLLKVFGVLLILYILSKFIYDTCIKTYKLQTTDNINNLKASQNGILQQRYGNTITRANLKSATDKIPEDQRLLINENVLSTRLTGYLGPYSYGVFDEDNAVTTALSVGSRCLILEIDRLENSLDPILLYRDSQGIRYSLNEGSIQRVAQNIAGRAFTGGNNDPLIVVIYFRSAPSPINELKNYVLFLAAVAKQLQPLKNLLIGQTPQGDFHRQGLESQLFFYPTSMFENRIIMMTNADTTAFRKLSSTGLQGQIGDDQDLDYMIHARLYAKESPSPFGITASPTSSVTPAAVITTPAYWLTIPPDRVADAIANTKKTWTLVMQPNPDSSVMDVGATLAYPIAGALAAATTIIYARAANGGGVINSALLLAGGAVAVVAAVTQLAAVVAAAGSSPVTTDNLDKLYNTYGIHSFPFFLTDDSKITDMWLAKGGFFDIKRWNVKAEPLRFIPPKPIVIQNAIARANSDGGAVVAPTL